MVAYLGVNMRKIFKFLKALIKWAACGFRFFKLAQERFTICRGCPELRGFICKVCGCNLKLKTKFLTEECPLKKW
mgnify:CR=1 FL=1